MIKILDIATTSQGAYRLLRLRVSEINKEREYSNAILCPSGSEVSLMREKGIPVYTIQMSRGLNPLNLPSEIRSLIRVFNEFKPDIIHSHNSKAGGVSRLAAFIYNKRKSNLKITVIHQVHGFVFSRFSGLKRFFYVQMEKILSRITDYLLFQNSNDLEFSIENKFGNNAELIKIGNGISFSELKKSSKDSNENSFKLIVCVARLEPVKNQTMLIESLAILKKKFKFDNFKCVFIGEGNSGNYSELVTRLGLDSHIIFSGMVSRDKIVNYYNNAELNVLTSFSEGMPRALMEAIYMGVPSIGTRVIGTTEVIKPGISGELVELGDIEGLAEIMHDLLNNEDKRLQLVKSGIEYAEIHFNEQNVIKYLQEIYIKAKN